MSLYGPDDLLHAPGPTPDWQESVVLIFFDDATGVGGFLRVGTEPNLKISQVHFDLFTRDGLRFRHNPFDIAMTPRDRRADGFAAGSLDWTIPGGDFVRVTANERDADIDLRLYDFFPSVPWRFAGAGDMHQLAAGHLESSGRVEGRVRIGERVFSIANALGHRDHSWGPRDVRTMRNFRWVAGTTGPALSFSGVVVNLANGMFMKAGWVCRDGKVEHARDVDMLAHVNIDGLTTRGGHMLMTLEGGETVRVDAEVIDGIVTSYRSDHGGPGSHVGAEGIAVARAAQRVGMCDFNISDNVAGGEQPAATVCEEWATLKPGLSQRPRRATA